MNHTFTGQHTKQTILQLLQQQGYEFIKDTITGKYSGEILLADYLQAALNRINGELPVKVYKEAIRQIISVQAETLPEANEHFHKFLTEGIIVEDVEREKVYKVKLIDYDNPQNNSFTIGNEWKIEDAYQTIQPDTILFINGLPLVLIEINRYIESAFLQLQYYQTAAPRLFSYNSILIVTDGQYAKVGTLTSDKHQFKKWRIAGNNPDYNPDYSSEMQGVFAGVLEKNTFLDLLKHFIVFSNQRNKHKILAAQHQFNAVNAAVKSTLNSYISGNTNAGVIWHTQGSGKTMTMVFYAGKVLATPSLDSPTILILTDRTVLEHQLRSTFCEFQELINQAPVWIENRNHLKSVLAGYSGELIISTIQKFISPKDVNDPMLSDRKNILVIVDEASRSQQGEMGLYVRKALPNALFIGFTQMPFEKRDKNIQALFGNYIDVYDIKQAIEDELVVPIRYESRLTDFTPENKKQKYTRLIEITEEDELSEVQQINEEWIRKEAFWGHPLRLKSVAEDIINHFEQRNEQVTNKAMIVCISRQVCIELFNQIIKIRPQWYNPEDEKGVIKIVMTGSSSDPYEWQEHIGNPYRTNILAKRFKDPQDELKLIIVRDMWLTGFDMPCLNTIYLDRPMEGTQLLQLLSRVNRVYGDKTNGLIVDYAGNKKQLYEALNSYFSIREKYKDERQENENIREIKNTIIQKKKEILNSQKETLKELTQLAKEVEKVDKEREKLNLSPEEMLFYSALNTENEEMNALGTDTLIQIVKESMKSIQELMTFDWVYKASVQAKMKIAIKRILLKHQYPLNEQAQAIEQIMEVAKRLDIPTNN